MPLCGRLRGLPLGRAVEGGRLVPVGLGPALEGHPAFPGGVNTEFVRCAAPDRLVMRVWERGSGETLACGTGACAALAAAVVQGRCGRRAAVELPGGVLALEWPAGAEMTMTGPANTVFEGEYPV